MGATPPQKDECAEILLKMAGLPLEYIMPPPGPHIKPKGTDWLGDAIVRSCRILAFAINIGKHLVGQATEEECQESYMFGNKLILEFMGYYKISEEENKFTHPGYPGIIINLEDTDYHKSWDKLKEFALRNYSLQSEYFVYDNIEKAIWNKDIDMLYFTFICDIHKYNTDSLLAIAITYPEITANEEE